MLNRNTTSAIPFHFQAALLLKKIKIKITDDNWFPKLHIKLFVLEQKYKIYNA